MFKDSRERALNTNLQSTTILRKGLEIKGYNIKFYYFGKTYFSLEKILLWDFEEKKTFFYVVKTLWNLYFLKEEKKKKNVIKHMYFCRRHFLKTSFVCRKAFWKTFYYWKHWNIYLFLFFVFPLFEITDFYFEKQFLKTVLY